MRRQDAIQAKLTVQVTFDRIRSRLTKRGTPEAGRAARACRTAALR